jgi:transcriptional regulator GlxA family with amidase domain
VEVFMLQTILAVALSTTPAESSFRPANVAFLMLEGVYNTELMAPFDVLHHVMFHDEKPPRVFTVALSAEPVITFEGLRITPDYTIDNAPTIDVLVVPSATNNMDSDLANERLIRWVAETGKKARHVISLCDGAFVLAKAGLLDGTPATTFPGDQDRFENMFPKVKLVRNVSFVDAGHALTSVGGAKSYDVAMYFVEKVYGEKAAKGIGIGLVIDWDLSQVPHEVSRVSSDDDRPGR